MAYSNLQIEWTDIIRFGSEGIEIADYAIMKKALANKFKSIYGEDIDLSTTSADGIYVETLCLMLNNMLQSFKTFYSQLDIKTASGVWLDMLCALSNITRKGASASTASIQLTLDSSETAQSFSSIELVDQAGITWKWSSTDPVTLQPGVPNASFVFTCEQLGPISAKGGTAANNYLDGWIDKTVNATPIIAVAQLADADLGSYAESDTELRARQHNAGNAIGMTTLDSLVGALLKLGGIQDVRLYNNDGSYATSTQLPTGLQAKDGTNVAIHGLYILIRKKGNVTVADSSIGTVILNKLTPGIQTTQSAVSADRKSWSYVQYIQQVPTGLTQTFHWRQATAVHPAIVITLSANEYFASANDTQSKMIIDKIINYANNLHISDNLELEELKEIVKYADMKFRGKSTYSTSSITINSSAADYTNADTYFDYSASRSTISTSGSTITITVQ